MCFILFTIGILSEFLSFFQLCLIQTHAAKHVNDRSLSINLNKEKRTIVKTYNSIELSSISRANSKQNLIENNTLNDAISTNQNKKNKDLNIESNYQAQTHFDLIKYHPTDSTDYKLFLHKQLQTSQLSK